MYVLISYKSPQQTNNFYNVALKYESIEYVSLYPHRIIFGAEIKLMHDSIITSYALPSVAKQERDYSGNACSDSSYNDSENSNENGCSDDIPMSGHLRNQASYYSYEIENMNCDNLKCVFECIKEYRHHVDCLFIVFNDTIRFDSALSIVENVSRSLLDI